jgi:outer membrane protein OmpA-like peptidoglycan-associated protein
MRQQSGRGSSGDRTSSSTFAQSQTTGSVPGNARLSNKYTGKASRLPFNSSRPRDRRSQSATATPRTAIEPRRARATIDTGTADARFPRIAVLMQRGTSSAGLRSALSADPSLAQEIPAYLAAGGDSRLNDITAAAFPATPPVGKQADDNSGSAGMAGAGASSIVTSSGNAGTKSEKQPTDPTQPLPPARTGNKGLDKGVMKRTLKADDHETANVDVDFKPDASKVEAKNVSFVQTVISKVEALSLKRAENARDYLTSKGIAAARIEVQSYSLVAQVGPPTTDYMFSIDKLETKPHPVMTGRFIAHYATPAMAAKSAAWIKSWSARGEFPFAIPPSPNMIDLYNRMAKAIAGLTLIQEGNRVQIDWDSDMLGGLQNMFSFLELAGDRLQSAP